jgi:hypothetical protein
VSMSIQPMPAPELDDLEADFLHSSDESWLPLPLRGVELPSSLTEDGPENRVTKIRTNSGCCR